LAPLLSLSYSSQSSDLSTYCITVSDDLWLTCNYPGRNRGAHFEQAKTAFEEGAGNDELEVEEAPREKLSDDDEKPSIEHINNV
jgi:hypothetical protein